MGSKALIFLRIIKWWLILSLASQCVLLIIHCFTLQLTPCLINYTKKYEQLVAKSFCLIYGLVEYDVLNGYYIRLWVTTRFIYLIFWILLLVFFSSIRRFAQQRDWSTKKWLIFFIIVLSLVNFLSFYLNIYVQLGRIDTNEILSITLTIISNDFFYIIQNLLWLWFVHKIITVDLTKTDNTI